jgi:hypothetical protein
MMRACRDHLQVCCIPLAHTRHVLNELLPVLTEVVESARPPAEPFFWVGGEGLRWQLADTSAAAQFGIYVA